MIRLFETEFMKIINNNVRPFLINFKFMWSDRFTKYPYFFFWRFYLSLFYLIYYLSPKLPLRNPFYKQITKRVNKNKLQISYGYFLQNKLFKYNNFFGGHELVWGQPGYVNNQISKKIEIRLFYIYNMDNLKFLLFSRKSRK